MKKVIKNNKKPANKQKSTPKKALKGSKRSNKPSLSNSSGKHQKTPHKSIGKGNFQTTKQKSTSHNRREVVAVTIHYKQPR